jgi:WhiB family redox-sensing transcriptional regulator
VSSVPELRLVAGGDARAGAGSWMARAACRGTDPETFFPVSVTAAAAGQVRSAKAVCGRCEVLADCLSYALRAMPQGIWGGTTREERIVMRMPLTGINRKVNS